MSPGDAVAALPLDKHLVDLGLIKVADRRLINRFFRNLAAAMDFASLTDPVQHCAAYS